MNVRIRALFTLGFHSQRIFPDFLTTTTTTILPSSASSLQVFFDLGAALRSLFLRLEVGQAGPFMAEVAKAVVPWELFKLISVGVMSFTHFQLISFLKFMIKFLSV